MNESNVATPMPQYQSHKKVWALKILTVNSSGTPEDVGAILTFEHPYGPRSVSAEYYRKHQPKAGGYMVVYEDGYESWSPADAFEAGYTRL